MPDSNSTVGGHKVAEPQRTWMPDPNPWTPMTRHSDLQHLGKFAEECGEAASAAARCIIQGIDECEPSTGEVNRRWLEKEIADVLANAKLVIEHFKLDVEFIDDRAAHKTEYLRRWHADTSEETLPQHCDHCGASRDVRSPLCAPPFDVQPHAWTGKHPADRRRAKRGASS